MALPCRFSALQRAEIAEIWVIGVRASGVETGFSALQRAEIAEMTHPTTHHRRTEGVSVLFNEPKLLKSIETLLRYIPGDVSVLFNEPKLLK